MEIKKVIESEKKLGFGMMRLPKLPEGRENEYDNIDVEAVKKMVDIFLERGFTYFDTAMMYHNYKSELVAREALVKRHPRDSFTLATKFHMTYMKKYDSPLEVFEKQLANCGVDYFDYYLLHDIGHDNYGSFAECGAFDMVMEEKRKGRIRHVGFSSHDSADFIDLILTEHPELEFVQLQVNYLDWDSVGINAHASCDAAAKHGRQVIVMEPVKGGTLADVPDEVRSMFEEREPDMSPASWAIRFAAGIDNVGVVLSGMSSVEQMLDNTGYMMDFKKLDDDELAMVGRAAEIISSDIAIPCTGCSYCTEGCPMKIAIPQYFSLYNTDMREKKDDSWSQQFEYYGRIATHAGRASDCIGCGKCEKICPQHLEIRELLKEVAEHFEKEDEEEDE